jgi:hypothetical protein
MDSPDFPVPHGRYRLTAALDDRLRALTGAPARGAAQAAHPVFAFVMALGGMGLCIADLAEALDLDFGAGPVLAACSLDYHTPLQVGRDYDVAARVAGLSRKPSRRFGAADHLHLAIVLAHEGQPYAQARLHIVFPASEVA